MKHITLFLLLAVLAGTVESALAQPARPLPQDTLLTRQQRLERKVDSLATIITTQTTVDQRAWNWLEQTQRSVDRAIDVTTRGVTWVQVLVVIFTALVGFAGFMGWADRVRNVRVREELRELESRLRQKEAEIDRLLAGVRGKAEEVSKRSASIEQVYRQTVQRRAVLERQGTLTAPGAGGAQPAPEVQAELTELGTRLKVLEELGVQLEPEDLYAQAVALDYKGNYEEALDVFDKALTIREDYWPAWDGKGLTLAKLGRFEEALQAHNRALAIVPSSVNPLYNRACTYAKMGARAEALADLRSVVRRDPKRRLDARQDDDFRMLRSDPEFRELVGE